MANMNKEFPGQNKTPQQYEDSTKFVGYSILGMIILIIIMTLLGGCVTTNETPKKPCCKTEKKC
jgi:hypothetical protein